MYVNGVAVPNLTGIAPESVLGLEAYSLSQPGPAQFSPSPCGMILVWTK